MEPDKPNIARIYDYFLGGTSNFPVDRAAADTIIAISPRVPQTVRENRAFLGRAVGYLARELGIRQFLDLGAGLPTMDNVHEIAQDARVVYVDNDPDVIAQATTLLAETEGVGAIEADVRDPAAILEHRVTRELLDLTQPTALLFVSILHFLTDDDHPRDLVHRYLQALAPGSYLVLTHAGGPDQADLAAESRESERVYNASTDNALNLRTTEQITALFDGVELLEPGVVNIAEWHASPANPDDEALGGFYGGIGRVA